MDHPGEDGANGPDLESRVLGLKTNVDRLPAVLARLEPRLTELAFTTAKAAYIAKVQVGLSELTHWAAKSSDLHPLRSDVAEIKGRVASLPTWWMLMITVLSPWMTGAAIVLTVVKATHP